jgi:type IV pilus assembly protein PilB
VTKADIYKTMAGQFGLEFVSLKGLEVEQEILDTIPADVVHRYKVLPVWRSGSTLTVAISDPLDVDTVDSLRYILKTHVEPVVALEDEIRSFIKLYYPSSTVMSHTIEEMTQSTLAMAVTDTKGLGLFDDTSATEEDAPIIKLVSLIIMQRLQATARPTFTSSRSSASCACATGLTACCRSVESRRPKACRPRSSSASRSWPTCQIAEKRVPQDGRIQINVGGRDLDLRVSTVLPACMASRSSCVSWTRRALKLGLPQLGLPLRRPGHLRAADPSCPTGSCWSPGPPGPAKPRRSTAA